MKSSAKEISKEASLKVVGSSFYRWDSKTSYYPTLSGNVCLELPEAGTDSSIKV